MNRRSPILLTVAFAFALAVAPALAAEVRRRPARRLLGAIQRPVGLPAKLAIVRQTSLVRAPALAATIGGMMVGRAEAALVPVGMEYSVWTFLGIVPLRILPS